MEVKTLREVCELVGITRIVIQGYENVGLVSSSGKNKYGYLLYDQNAIERIRIARQYQEFGFSVKEIKLLLEVSQEIYVTKMMEKLALMKRKVNALEVNIQKMEDMILNANNHKNV